MPPHFTDKQLTDNLKLDVDTENSLQELINRHSGIFLDIVTSYIPKGSATGCREDLINDLGYYVYNAGLKYDRFMYENNLVSQEKPFVDEKVLNKIFNIIDHHPDKRVQKIFKLRYVEPKFNKLTPWKRVSKELKMSIQGCINIHNSAIKIIRKELKNKHELDI